MINSVYSMTKVNYWNVFITFTCKIKLIYNRQKDQECKPDLKERATISHRKTSTNLGKDTATNSMSEHFTKEITVKSRMSKISKDGFKKDILEWINMNLSRTSCLLYSNFYKGLLLESCVVYSSVHQRLSAWVLFMMPGYVDTKHAWQNRGLNCCN